MGLEIEGSPATGGTVVTLAEAKAHIRVDIDDDDTLISALIDAATEYAETYTRRKFLTGTLTQFFDVFVDEMELDRPPLQSVTSITYIDVAGDTQTLSTDVYDVDTSVEPGVVRLAFNQSWPSILNTPNAITATYVAGYGAPDAVPQTTKQAILMLVSHWYENREDTITGATTSLVPRAVDTLLWSTRLAEVF